VKRWLALLLPAIACLAAPARAQQSPPAEKPPQEEFLKAADEVLAEVSRIVALPVKAPLRKSVRSKDEIREFVIAELRKERDPQKWRADQRALERFGLIPRGFELEPFLIDLLTEQIAGLYDPGRREFYIAASTGAIELRMVMAHELVHALQDQHFHIEPWLNSVRANDDASLARHSVLEGSALLGMLDYILGGQNLTTRDLPGLDALLRTSLLSEMANSPEMAKAPPFIRDSLLFPYLEGAVFSQRLLQSAGGWKEFYRVFDNPPATSQQILHPDLYFQGFRPEPVTIPALPGAGQEAWTLLDENVMGEFGLNAILKEHLGAERAAALSPAWRGDLYAIYEHQRSGKSILLFRVRTAGEEEMARLFGALSETLEKKYPDRRQLLRRPNFFSFESSADGSAFLYCRSTECFSAEGASRAQFDALVRGLGWPAAPRPAAPARSVALGAAPPQ
jgi:hypothetical protein